MKNKLKLDKLKGSCNKLVLSPLDKAMLSPLGANTARLDQIKPSPRLNTSNGFSGRKSIENLLKGPMDDFKKAENKLKVSEKIIKFREEKIKQKFEKLGEAVKRAQKEDIKKYAA